MVWGIAGDRDTQVQVQRFVEQLGVTFPILYDNGAAVIEQYRLRHDFGTRYPIDWVVGKDGRIIYVNDGYEPDEIRAVLDAELAR